MIGVKPSASRLPPPASRLPDGVVLSIEDLWVEFQSPAGPMQAVRGATLEIRSDSKSASLSAGDRN